MAYNKKNWQDNVSDITAAELNRMEQGIYDNSLVVDVIKDKLNPTDTETYKTTELTEGQITDVIGVSDILIKGQTSQDGEPTPSSPVDVNVVSGSNVINTSNKNLFNPTYTFSEKGVTSVIINQQIKWNGTSSTGISYKMADINMPIGTYKITLDVISGTHDNSKHIWIDFYNNNTKVASNNWFTSGTRTNKLNSSVNAIYLGFDPSDTFNNFTFRMQIEKDTATTYEPHQGKELPLDLPVENLFDKDNEAYTKAFIYDTSSTSLIDSYYQRTLYIPCKPNTTYAIQKMVSKSNSKFLIASSVDVPAPEVSIYNVVNGGMSNTRAIYTTSNNAKYLLITYMQTNATSTTLQEMLNSIQIEESSKANAYTPYGTDPIELCKIGDYQDYFYKSGNKWYLVKNFNKYVEESNNAWGSTGIAPGSNVNTIRWLIYKDINDSFDVNGGNMNRNMYCNYFNRNLLGQMYGLDEVGYNLESKKFSIRLPVEIATTATEVAQYFSQQEKPLTFYYQIAPTTIEITGTLKEQLEAIYNAPLYEQTNITQTNNDLPMVLDITACKDNINGIKAFIRK